MKEYYRIALVVGILALMDGFNFVIPHNSGYFSLTYDDSFFRWDIWHHLKILLLIVVFIDRKKMNIIKWIYFGLIAFVGQIIIYNLLFKSLI